MRAVTLPALILLAALSACGGAPEKGPERKTAAGEVLGGSISDAMLPLDTVQSQNPPLRESAAEGGEGADGDAPDGDATNPAAGAAPEAASSTPAAPASVSAAPAAEE